MISDVLPLGISHEQTFNLLPRQGQIKQADLFAGGGGATTGSLWAYRELGIDVEMVAINHNPRCVQTHGENYPEHVHLCTGVDAVHPKVIFAKAQMDGLWASPCCTHHSSARGGTPVNPQLRATSWQVVRWARAKKPKVFWIENVQELQSWGRVRQMKDDKGRPLFLRNEGTDTKSKWVKCLAPGKGRPRGTNVRTWWKKMESMGYKPAFEADPRYKGETYQKFIRQLRREGYDVEVRVLNSADFGAPTARRRLFIYGVRQDSGLKIVWPNPTHAKPDANGAVPPGLLPWVGAKTVINFAKRGTSIFERDVPLKPKTIQRIIAGLRKFGLHPYLIPSKGSSDLRIRDPRLPLQTLTTESRGEAVAQPFLLKLRGTNDAADINYPAPTITAGGTHLGIVEPFLVQMNHGTSSDTSDAAARTRSPDTPLPTVCGSRGEWGVCSSFLTQVSHGVGPKEKAAHNRRLKPVAEPVPAITGSNDWAITHAFLLSQQSGGIARDVNEPAPTIATGGALHLVEAAVTRFASAPKTGRPVVEIGGELYVLDIFHRMLDDEELARAQSFPSSYKFAGNKSERIKQIGNAVPPLVSRALVKAFWSQNPQVGVAPQELLTALAA